ncbi:NFYB/HAP3 family transcription factor subunit [bacterium]|nr:NFYB/HAP3 family transcription factor subunit [bacterium]
MLSNTAAANVVNVKNKQKRRLRPGTRALREIRRFQKSTDLLLRRLPFQRSVRECVRSNNDGLRIQGAALLTLQQAAEDFLASTLQKANLIAIHSKRVTVMPRDLRAVLELCAEYQTNFDLAQDAEE